MRLRILAALLLLGLAAPAPASDPSPGEGGHAAAEEAKGGADFLKKDLERYDLGIYTLIVFAALFFIIAWYAWPKISAGLQKREQSIQDARAAAEQARDEARAIAEQVKRREAHAHEQARGVLDEARKDADAWKEAERARLLAEIQAERERLRKEIETARDQALKDIWTMSVQLATLMSSKAVKREMSADDHKRLLDEALADLRQNLGGRA